MALSPFAEWLLRQMDLAGFDSNQSKLAAYMDTRASTVNSWFTRGAIPEPPMCERLAHALRIDVTEVFRAAGHPAPARPPETESLPVWLRELLPMLSQLDPVEGKAVEYSARAQLEMREERAKYEAEE